MPEAFVMEEAGEPWTVLLHACQNGGEPACDSRYGRMRYMKRPCLPNGR